MYISCRTVRSRKRTRELLRRTAGGEAHTRALLIKNQPSYTDYTLHKSKTGCLYGNAPLHGRSHPHPSAQNCKNATWCLNTKRQPRRAAACQPGTAVNNDFTRYSNGESEAGPLTQLSVCQGAHSTQGGKSRRHAVLRWAAFWLTQRSKSALALRCPPACSDPQPKLSAISLCGRFVAIDVAWQTRQGRARPLHGALEHLLLRGTGDLLLRGTGDSLPLQHALLGNGDCLLPRDGLPRCPPAPVEAPELKRCMPR